MSTPTITVTAPGRINLIGEHIDYNNGFVMPAAIQFAATVQITKREDTIIHLTALDLNESITIDVNAIHPQETQWANYIIGVLAQFQKIKSFTSGFNLKLKSNVPIGAGLSSSAAIESAVAFAINTIFEYHLSKMELAFIGQKAEHEYAGVQCGIMDQFASVFGKKNQVILLDCQNMDYQYFPLNLDGYSIVLLDTQIKHALANSEYNTRKMECEKGIELMQVQYPAIKSLREATLEMLDASVRPAVFPKVYNRCKYVIEEIARTQLAAVDLENNNLIQFGQKMFATHEGLSKLYEVSCSELDLLVQWAKEETSIMGARMMGGGFGGCTINLIQTQKVASIIDNMTHKYLTHTGKKLVSYIVQVEDGAHIL